MIPHEPNGPNANAHPSKDTSEAIGDKASEDGSLADFFASDPSIPPPSNPASFAQKRPLRILITDDNAINRNVIQTILERLGYNPTEASSGEEALSLLKRDIFDILFTDIDMPTMDGIELSQTVRNYQTTVKPDSNKTEIIAVTANTSLETRRKCKQAGMNGFLEKPVDLETIKKQILKSWRRIKTRPSRP